MKNYLNHVIMGRYSTVLLMLFSVLVSMTAEAQMSNLNKGDRVRVVAPGVYSKSIVGTVYDVSSTKMLVTYKDSSISIPFNSVKQLDISMGKRRHAGKGALVGAVAGGLALGSILVAGNGANDNSCEDNTGWLCFNFLQTSDDLAFAAGAIMGALGGALAGGAAGAFIQTERWERMPVEVSMSFNASRSQNLSLSPSVSLKFPMSRDR